VWREVGRGSAALLLAGAVSLGVAAPASAETVTPKAYAQQVCPAFARFVAKVVATGDSVKRARTQTEVARNLTATLEGAIKANTKLVNALRHAGTPDAKGGKQTAQLLLDEFDSLGKEFKGAQADAIFLEFTPEQDFPAALGALQQRIQQAISGTVERIGANIDPKVNAAFDSNKACAAISST
jgi:hypothetical protein